ncbi:protein kinase, partial [bacterium]|nr:protein kinase [bacterium]
MNKIKKISCPYCKAAIDIDSRFCKDCGSSISVELVHETPSVGINIVPKKVLDGDTIFGDRFKILMKVGEGGFGSVYKAEDKRLNEIVCLKVLDVKLTLDLAHKDRFVREIKLARKITHPNVVRMFDFAEIGDTYVVTMEFVDGCTLQESLKRGNLTTNDMISYVEQICRALDAAHVMGIIHRDIKPGNILIDKDDNVKIVDFGLAKVGDITGVTDSGAIMGTPEYMSPEQVLSQPVDNRADFYSLGLIMYEMFTGVIPFKGDTPMATALKRTVEDLVPPKIINPTLMNWLNRIIMKMIQRDKNKRYSSGSEIIYDLAKGRGESSIVEEYLKRVEFYIEEKDYEKGKTLL